MVISGIKNANTRKSIMRPQLTVYKASAGSGKTFTLACEYMTLVIDNPLAYRTILAVTFTNKATEEMKLRILSQLYGISRHLPSSADYLKKIKEALPHLSEQQIEKNAQTALGLLIHNYNYFRVETIDTFFQSVLRNLARELDLTANLRIGLNDYQVEQQAVDELIESLVDTDLLLFWIMDYIQENIADDKSWNVIGQIKKFGENIFKDFYKDHAAKLEECIQQEGFFKAYTAKIRKIRDTARGNIQQYAASFFDALEENNLSSDDLAGKTRGIWSYFNKLRQGKIDDSDLLNGTVEKCRNDEKAWVKGSDAVDGNPAFECVKACLFRMLNDSEADRPKNVRAIKSADLTLKHLNQLRLLGSIDRKVREMNQEANRFLLSDTQTLLHSLIQDSDSPFIFEKIGTQLEHVMIDEFQDTSTVQWKNFKVLLEETMSHENAGNLIVGDVKQSIYRWRSGDWRLLNNIKEEFESEGKSVEIKDLDTNYRSDRNIIDFNNAFFTVAEVKEREAVQEANPQEARQLKNAYAAVKQKVRKEKPDQGYVQMRLFASTADKETVMAETLATVSQLVEQGVEYRQIAILVRSNRTIQDIADYFMANSDYPMVSDEAFRLDASQAVCTLVAALRLLTSPQDEIGRTVLRKFALRFLGSEAAVDLLDEQREQLLQMPLFDLTERLFTEFRLGEIEEMKQQSAYVCAFYDQLNSFLTDNSSDIDSFLEEWDNSIHEKSIHSDSIDGIRLITIHKSKGLEFDHVVMPFCDWTLEKSNTIWCSPQEEPYSELPLVPVDFSAKQMKGSIYEEDYHHEHLQNVVDNLNLLYVAFTRASHSLFVLAKRGTAASRSSIIEQSLPEVKKELSSLSPSVTLEGCDSDAKTSDILFEYGDLATSVPKKEKKEKKASTNVFTMPQESITIDIAATPELPEFRQSNKSRDFIEGDEEEEQQKHYIKMGTVMHSLFSTIHHADDVEGALRQLELDGVLYDENISREKVEKMVRKRLETPMVKDWFSQRWTVFNECAILSVEDGKVKEHRPDRVMRREGETVVVDFKFGKPKEEHHRQVRQYMDLLSGMGHENVRGYLWYVYPNRIEEVK